MKHQTTLVLVLSAVCLLTYLTNYLPEEVFLQLSEEDGIFEYLTAILFFLTSLSFLLLFFNPGRFRRAKDRELYSTRGRRYVFLILAFVFLFGAGEEISWGQRIFQFETPDKIHEMNVQEEFNIHNLEIFNIKSKDGVRKTGIAKLFTMKQLFLGSFLLYLLIIPLLARNFSSFKELLNRIYIPIPAIGLGILFIINFGLYRIIRMIRPWDLQWGLTEVQEFNFSLLLFFLPFVWLGFRSTREASTHQMDVVKIQGHSLKTQNID